MTQINKRTRRRKSEFNIYLIVCLVSYGKQSNRGSQTLIKLTVTKTPSQVINMQNITILFGKNIPEKSS